MSLDVYLTDDIGEEVFARNITHNVNVIAERVGVYMHLWRPDEMEPPITLARELVAPLTAGIAALVERREELRAYEPSNGWGSVDGLIAFVRAYRDACEEYPSARVRVSR